MKVPHVSFHPSLSVKAVCDIVLIQLESQGSLLITLKAHRGLSGARGSRKERWQLQHSQNTLHTVTSGLWDFRIHSTEAGCVL